MCVSEVIDISPGSLESRLCFLQPSILHDVLGVDVKQAGERHSLALPLSQSVASPPFHARFSLLLPDLHAGFSEAGRVACFPVSSRTFQSALCCFVQLREFAFGGQWDLISELPQDWGNSLGGHSKPCVQQDPGDRDSDPSGDEPDLAVHVWGSLADLWVDSGLPWGQGH